MSEPDDGPDLSPAQEAEVRRWLAESRHTGPMPAHVVDRMERVLGDLAGEPQRDAAVVRLGERRRRAATMLVAAAAVVVAGIGIGQVVGGGHGAEESTAGAGQAEDAARPSRPEAAEEGAGALLDRERISFRIRPDRFAEDVGLLQQQVAVSSLARGEGDAEVEAERPTLRRAKGATCAPGRWGSGDYQPVRYGGAPGYVVLRQARGETQVADLFLCGSDQAERSVTLPAP